MTVSLRAQRPAGSRFRCVVCWTEYDTTFALGAHIRSVHPWALSGVPRMPRAPRPRTAEPAPVPPEVPDGVPCRACGRRFRPYRTTQAHCSQRCQKRWAHQRDRAGRKERMGEVQQ